MKNLFILFGLIALISFTACSSVTMKPAKNNPYVGKDVNTYWIGDYMDVESAKKKLNKAGFEVIATYSPIKKGTTIIFTDAALQKQALKTGRTHIAVLRLFLDEKTKILSIVNPIYFGKAFMQNDFEYDVFAQELQKLQQAFPNLRPSPDKLNYDALASYHFMVSMPYYEDQDLLKEGQTTNELLAKVQKYKKGKNIVFILKLSGNTALVGYDLSRRTKRFVKKIGRQNGAILPWTIAIENGKATALNAKYYIALSYPLLDMGGFMGIATVPGAITKDLQKPFKK
ncbi:hypothetical protein [Sulfurimonas sp.]